MLDGVCVFIAASCTWNADISWEEEAEVVIMAALSKAAHAVAVPGQLQGD